MYAHCQSSSSCNEMSEPSESRNLGVMNMVGQLSVKAIITSHCVVSHRIGRSYSLLSLKRTRSTKEASVKSSGILCWGNLVSQKLHPLDKGVEDAPWPSSLAGTAT